LAKANTFFKISSTAAKTIKKAPGAKANTERERQERARHASCQAEILLILSISVSFVDFLG